MNKPGQTSSRRALSGVLVIDKPKGPTSHDVVFRLRRALGMRRIGHAGTLDPMATGVLVVLLGEATKLGPYLTAHDKRYEARVLLGQATGTLDAMGTVTESAPLPDWFEDERTARARFDAALREELARTTQKPPAFSAIKVSGQKSYDRARRGEDVELEARPVSAQSIELVSSGTLTPGALGYVDASLHVSKGYYVRSFARDFGLAIGLPAHLGALRRTQSGPFTLADAVPLDAPREALFAAVLGIPEAVRRGMPTAVLTPSGTVRASQGKRLVSADFSALPETSDEPMAWLSPEGRLVAVGISSHDVFVVQRGFAPEDDAQEADAVDPADQGDARKTDETG